MPRPPRFCPRCGATIPPASPGEQPACPAGDYTWYVDPKVAVGVVVARGDEILLVQRNHDPAYGRWAFPSGFVDAGEVVEDAARREVLEETGVTVRLDGLLGVYSERGNPVVFIAYAGVPVEGEPTPGDEAIAVAYFASSALPELPFPHDPLVLDAWRARETRTA